MTAADDGPGPAEGAPAPAERIPGGWIAVTLATIVVAGATLAILQTDAGNNESNTARQTTRTATSALRAGVLSSAAEDLEADIVAQTGVFDAQRAAVVARARAAGATAAPLTIGELRAAAGATSELPRARSSRQVRDLALEARRLTLKQAALAETRVTWNDRSTQYTTAIAMLAVSLFLVGFAVVLTGAARTTFYVLGVAFALGTIGWAVHIYRLPVPGTPDGAIAATATGMVDSDAGRQDRAIAAFTRAVDLDGDYVVPLRERAVARVLEANPDYRATGAVTGGGAALDAAIADARRALDLGSAPDFRTYAFLTLLRLHTGDYTGAVEAADRAIAINGEVPDVRLARSAAQAGLGDGAAAQASLDGALRLLSGSDPGARTRALAARDITELEQVAWATPRRAPLARRLEAEIVAVETRFNLGRRVPGRPPASGTVAVEGLRYADGALHVRLRWRGLPEGTSLTGLAFERPAPGGPWVQPTELALFRTVSGSGRQEIAVPLTRACTPTRVRADVYLDGARAVSATGPGGEPTC